MMALVFAMLLFSVAMSISPGPVNMIIFFLNFCAKQRSNFDYAHNNTHCKQLIFKKVCCATILLLNYT
jgi:hypothetical protein